MTKINLTIEADNVQEYMDILTDLAHRHLISGIKAAIAEPAPKANPTPAPVAEVPAEKQEEKMLPLPAIRDEPDTDELDAHGHPWSADLHASTKGKTQDGLWRMGRGQTRPDPMPGYPKDFVAAVREAVEAADEQEDAGPVTTPENTPEVPVTAEAEIVEEGGVDDEFAQFASTDTPEEAATEVPAREWSDADVSNAANWAVNSLGGKPEGVVALRDKYIPAGMVPKTMNIPVDAREAFVTDLEKLVGAGYPG